MTKVDLFNVNEGTLKNYLSILKKDEHEIKVINNSFENWTSGINEIFKHYKKQIALGSYDDEYFIKIKHTTTFNENSLEYFKNNGFLSLREMLSRTDSPLRIFLDENNIKIDIVNCIVYINDLEIFYGGKFENHNLSYLKIKNKKYDISGYGVYSLTNNLRAKLNAHRGQTEFFVCGSFESITGYSFVNKRPEILFTLSKLCEDIFNYIRADKSVERAVKEKLYVCKEKLCSNWQKKFDKTYLISAYVDLNKTNVIDKVSWMFDDKICEVLGLNIYDFYDNSEPIINNYTLSISKALYIIYYIHHQFKGYNEDIIAVVDNSFIVDIEIKEI